MLGAILCWLHEVLEIVVLEKIFGMDPVERIRLGPGGSIIAKAIQEENERYLERKAQRLK